LRSSSRLTTVALAVSALALAVGCSLSLAASSSSIPGYSGAESTLPTSYGKPTVKSGTSCTIGFQNPLAANESLQWFQKAAAAQAKAYGCKIILLDDALSPDKQVSNMQQLLAQGAQAIIFYPLDPKATLPVLAQAKGKGVPVIAIDATFGNPKLPVAPGIVTQVWQGRDIMAFLQVQALKAAMPSGVKVGLVGIGAPVPALKYLNQREAFYAKKAGMTVLGTQDNPTDDVTGGEKAGNGLIQRYSDMNAVIGYNDPSALGTVIAARGANRKLVAIGLNGTSDGIAGVKSGQLAATVQGAPIDLGIQSVTAAYDLITKQHLPLPKVVVEPPRIVTKANVAKIVDWKTQLANISG
jgi:ABC-type sugar transport system substrate-binding protein